MHPMTYSDVRLALEYFGGSTAHLAKGFIMLFKMTSRALILGVMFFSESAFADCWISTPTSQAQAKLPPSLSTVRDSVASGIQFPSSTAGYAGHSVSRTSDCNFDEIIVTPLGKVVPGATFKGERGSAAVFETGIPGIGYALETKNANTPYDPIGSGPTVLPPGPPGSGAWGYYHRVTLVVTGAIETGTYSVPAKNILTISAMLGGAVVSNTPAASMAALSIAVTARTCKITSGATNTVVMPQLVTYSLKAVGDVSAAKSTPFSLGLQCDANLSVYATLTDATNPANTGNVLSLAKNSTASGLGIQIMKQGTTSPLNFGPDSSAKGNTNQWLVGKSGTSASVIKVPFEARYIKTEETIKPGTVSALSTITFSYQ